MGYDRERCKEIITAAGFPVPVKKACFFCPAMKNAEIVWLQEHHPDVLERARAIERNTQANLNPVKGLGRSFSWEVYLTRRQELPLFRGCGE